MNMLHYYILKIAVKNINTYLQMSGFYQVITMEQFFNVLDCFVTCFYSNSVVFVCMRFTIVVDLKLHFIHLLAVTRRLRRDFSIYNNIFVFWLSNVKYFGQDSTCDGLFSIFFSCVDLSNGICN